MIKPEPHSISIYYASAGSGKTYTLVKEYLKILLQSEHPDAYKRILAVTFTNKAVNEMKTRILDSLYGFSLDNPTQKIQDYRETIADEIGISAIQIQAKAKAIVKTLVHNYASFDIMTLDKFTHRVIRAFAIDFDLPVNFDVTLDTQSILQEALDRVLAEAGNDEQLTAILLEHIAATVQDGVSHRSLQAQLLEQSKVIVKDDHRGHFEEIKELTLDDFRIMQQKLRVKLNELNAEIEKRAKPLKAELEDLWNEGNFMRADSVFLKQIRAIETVELKQYFSDIDDITLNKSFDTAYIRTKVADLIVQLNHLYDLRGRKSRYLLILDKMLHMSLLLQIRRQYKDVQKERDEIPLADFNEMIASQLQKQPAMFIYERIGGKYNHFFIDEFQDTSVLQWQNLIPLIDNTTAGQTDDGTKGTLMIVGDPKQAIYRWRGGRASLLQRLANKEDMPFVNPDVETRILDTNFRSYSNVILFNNAFFEFINDEIDSEETKALYAQTASQKHTQKLGGSVRISQVETKEHVSVVFQSIQFHIENGFAFKDIAVLCNRNQDLNLVANALFDAEIPILSSESLLISASADVKLLVALLQLLYNDTNKLAQFELVFHLSKLQTALSGDVFIEKYIECWRSQKPEFPDEFHFPANFDEMRLMSVFSVCSLGVNWLEEIRNLQQSDSYLQTFLDTALHCESRGVSSLQDFLEYLESSIGQSISINPPPNLNAVHLLTIHKAKGLEFPVVIYPFLYVKNDTHGEDFWIENNSDETALPKTLIDSKVKERVLIDQAETVRVETLAARQTDKINQYYVGYTRAIEHLHILTVLPPKNSTIRFNPQRIIANFIEDFKMQESRPDSFVFGNDGTAFSASKPSGDIHYVPVIARRAQRSAIKIADKAALLWGSTTEKAIADGILLHELLAEIHSQNDISRVLEQALATGVITSQDIGFYESRILQIVKHSALSEFFNKENRVVTELSMLSKNRPILKPDRISFLNKTDVALLDYKTGVAKNEHKVQLEAYAETLTAMNYHVVKKALVYTRAEVEVITL